MLILWSSSQCWPIEDIADEHGIEETEHLKKVQSRRYSNQLIVSFKLLAGNCNLSVRSGDLSRNVGKLLFGHHVVDVEV